MKQQGAHRHVIRMSGYSKTGFTPTYDIATNQINGGGYNVSYDENGNVRNDGLSPNPISFDWDADGHPYHITKNSSVTTVTYDAFGRAVENGVGSSHTQIVYGPDGSKIALTNGLSTLTRAFIPLPGGAKAVYDSTGLLYYSHPDWLGTARLTSTVTGTVSEQFYQPYGETVSNSISDLSFTGQTQDTVTGLYDFMYRRYNPVHGRWMSPDPAGRSVVDPANPQTWNRYAYVAGNPVDAIDPDGLAMCLTNAGDYRPCDSGGGGPYTSSGYCPPRYSYCGVDPWGGGIPIGGGDGGGGGGGAPAPSPSPNPTPQPSRPIGGSWPNGETLGIPTGLPLNPGSIWSVFLPVDPQCDFGVCTSTGETWLQTRTPAQGQNPFDIQWIRDAGKIIGIRLFDWAGRAWRDIDFHGHGNNGPGNPHEHPWDWGKKPPRQPPVPITPTSIPGPFLIIIDTCILQPWQSWCKHGPGPSADENLQEPLELLKKEKVAEFARLPWHDAKLLEVKLFRDEIRDLDNLSCSIDFGASPKSFRRAVVSFLRCTIVKIDLDLDGKRVCADNISNATCEIDSALKQSLEAGSLRSENKPLSEFYHFRVAMVPPGGDLNVFAKDFEVLWAG